MEQKSNWLDRPIHSTLPGVTNEIAIFVGIMLLAVVTHFYNLGARVMSHDESLHTYFSWLLYRGQGYQHSPMMHGPWQFHLIALSYFLFGASDFTARIPAATFGIMIVGMMWLWRRYLGRSGGLIAAILMVISPMMLYYGRYVREDIYAGFSGVLMLYMVLRYLENGERKHLYLFTVALVIHFLDKETSYIYVAELLIYLSIYFFIKVARNPWKYNLSDYRAFIISLSIAVLLAGAAAGYVLYIRESSPLSGAETAVPSDPLSDAAPQTLPQAGTPLAIMLLAGATVVALAATAFFLIRGYTWQRLRSERSFDLLMVAGTIVLPLLSPLPINIVEKKFGLIIPTTFEEIQALDSRAIYIIGGFLILMFAIAILIGLVWDKDKFWKTSAIFWVPYTILYTTIFTNSAGFFTGTIGSLGYWLVQQDVHRGSQPWYFYLLIQIPIYEFLPAIGFFLALIIGIPRLIKVSKVVNHNEEENPEDEVITLYEGQISEQEKF